MNLNSLKLNRFLINYFHFQVTDYAFRKKIPMESVEHWLSPILGYENNLQISMVSSSYLFFIGGSDL